MECADEGRGLCPSRPSRLCGASDEAGPATGRSPTSGAPKRPRCSSETDLAALRCAARLRDRGAVGSGKCVLEAACKMLRLCCTHTNICYTQYSFLYILTGRFEARSTLESQRLLSSVLYFRIFCIFIYLYTFVHIRRFEARSTLERSQRRVRRIYNSPPFQYTAAGFVMVVCVRVCACVCVCVRERERER